MKRFEIRIPKIALNKKTPFNLDKEFLTIRDEYKFFPAYTYNEPELDCNYLGCKYIAITAPIREGKMARLEKL